MPVIREIQQPGDIIYTIAGGGEVRSFIVLDDGRLAEITLAEALRGEDDN